LTKSPVDKPVALPTSSQTAPTSLTDGQVDVDAEKDKKLESSSDKLTSWRWGSTITVIQLIIGICCIGTTWFLYKRIKLMDSEIAELSTRLDRMYSIESSVDTASVHDEL